MLTILLPVIICGSLLSALSWFIYLKRIKLNPPKYYNADGTSLWENVIPLTNKKSLGAVPTHYKVSRNAMSQRINNKLVFKSSWIDFILWNGYGIQSIQINELKSGKLLYPTDREVRNENILPNSKNSHDIFVQSSTNDDRYVIAAVKPEASEITLKIIGTDKRGNVSQGLVDISNLQLERG